MDRQRDPREACVRREEEQSRLEDDPRGETLTHGHLSEAEHAALRAEAEQSEAGRALYALSRRPFSAEEQARLHAAVSATVRANRRSRIQRRLLAVALVVAVAIVIARVGFPALPVLHVLSSGHRR
jgi:ferric-dicitrate binding protein FerR (iron transport regulator)